MRKLFIISLTVVALICLTACNSSTSNNTEESEETVSDNSGIALSDGENYLSVDDAFYSETDSGDVLILIKVTNQTDEPLESIMLFANIIDSHDVVIESSRHIGDNGINLAAKQSAYLRYYLDVDSFEQYKKDISAISITSAQIFNVFNDFDTMRNLTFSEPYVFKTKDLAEY